jgi:hypothetical protein
VTVEQAVTSSVPEDAFERDTSAALDEAPEAKAWQAL